MMRETCACGATIEANHSSDLTFFRLDHRHVEPQAPAPLLRPAPRLVTVKGGHMPRRLRERAA